MAIDVDTAVEIEENAHLIVVGYDDGHDGRFAELKTNVGDVMNGPYQLRWLCSEDEVFFRTTLCFQEVLQRMARSLGLETKQIRMVLNALFHDLWEYEHFQGGLPAIKNTIS